MTCWWPSPTASFAGHTGWTQAGGESVSLDVSWDYWSTSRVWYKQIANSSSFSPPFLWFSTLPGFLLYYLLLIVSTAYCKYRQSKSLHKAEKSILCLFCSGCHLSVFILPIFFPRQNKEDRNGQIKSITHRTLVDKGRTFLRVTSQSLEVQCCSCTRSTMLSNVAVVFKIVDASRAHIVDVKPTHIVHVRPTHIYYLLFTETNQLIK